MTNEFDAQVIRLLKDGGVGFMPSDTIYGLSGRALDQTAVAKAHKIKDRSGRKPFIVLISNTKMLDLLSINREEVKPAEKYWPGALTLICAAPSSPAWLHQGLKTLALRIPDNPDLLELINQTGPLISTSANFEGQEPAVTPKEAMTVFGDKLDFYVDKGPLQGQASTIARLGHGRVEVIRQGTVKL
jgi:L-threonylcarbamoyladenylate synthase